MNVGAISDHHRQTMIASTTHRSDQPPDRNSDSEGCQNPRSLLDVLCNARMPWDLCSCYPHPLCSQPANEARDEHADCVYLDRL
jgi:hypothetical protein